MSIARRQLDPLPAMDPLAARVKLGAEVHAIRCRRTLKAGAVADLLGVSGATYSIFEAGERPIPLHHVLTIVGSLQPAPDLAASVVVLAIQAACRNNEQARIALTGWGSCTALGLGCRVDASELQRWREALRHMLASADAELTRADVTAATENNAVQIAGRVAIPVCRLLPSFAGRTRAEKADAVLAWLGSVSPAARRGTGMDAVVFRDAPMPIGLTAGGSMCAANGDRKGRPPARLSITLFNFIVDAVSDRPTLSAHSVHARLVQAASQNRWGRVPSRGVITRIVDEFRRSWLGYHVAEETA